jgi:hypothetical protein
MTQVFISISLLQVVIYFAIDSVFDDDAMDIGG